MIRLRVVGFQPFPESQTIASLRVELPEPLVAVDDRFLKGHFVLHIAFKNGSHQCDSHSRVICDLTIRMEELEILCVDIIELKSAACNVAYNRT